MNYKKLITSLILSLGLARVGAELVLKSLPINLLNASLPSLLEETVKAKNLDLVEFAIFFVIGILVFIVNSRIKTSGLFETYYLIFSFFIFLLANSTHFSPAQIILMFALAQGIYFFSSRFPDKKVNFNLTSITVGISSGFTVMVASHTIFNSPWWGLFFLITIPFLAVYFLRDNKFLKKIPSWVSFTILIALVTYNPLFYVGNLDTIEEGFWLAWVQRLSQGQVIYRDFAAYHPPLIPWSLFGFMKIFGLSIFNQRLFFHLLQVLGLTIYFLFVSKLVKNHLVRIIIFVLALGLTTTGVRSNAEIRLASGLLAIMAWQNPFLAGALAGVSSLLSIEIGLSSIVALLIFGLLMAKNKIQTVVKLLSGFALAIAPFVLILLVKDAFIPFVSQVSFYGKAFSQGYLNIPIKRAVATTFFRVHLFYQFLSSTAFSWVFVKFVLLAATIFGGNLYLKKKYLAKDKFLILTTLFSLFVFRAALGRSDSLHLIPPLLIVIPVFFYLIKRLDKNPFVSIMAAFVFIFIFGSEVVFGSNNYLTRYIFYLQTYGRPVGEFKKFEHERANIMVGGEFGLERLGGMIEYIKTNTTPEETIFAYPWKPEFYFLVERKNATSFDTPYAFFSQKYQQQMVEELKKNNPKFIIYEPRKQFSNLEPGSLPLVDNYIQENFTIDKYFGRMEVLINK